MPDANARLTMRLSPVTSNREPHTYLQLVVEDVASGLPVVSFNLLGEHLLDLLANRLVGGVNGMEAWLIEPGDRAALGHLQFTTEHQFCMFQHTEDSVRSWAERNYAALGAASYSMWSNNHNKYVVRFTYYSEHTDVEALTAERLEYQATMDVASLHCPADRRGQ